MSLSNIEINRFLNGYETDLQDIFLEIRSLVIGALPDVREEITSKGVIFYHPDNANSGRWAKTGICYVTISDEVVEVGFMSLIPLKDTKSILSAPKGGKRKASFTDYEQVPWEALEALIQAAVEFDPQSIRYSK